MEQANHQVQMSGIGIMETVMLVVIQLILIYIQIMFLQMQHH